MNTDLKEIAPLVADEEECHSIVGKRFYPLGFLTTQLKDFSRNWYSRKGLGSAY